MEQGYDRPRKATEIIREYELMARFIKPNPDKDTVEEVFVEDIQVYAIVSDLNHYGGDITKVARDRAIPKEAVEAALAFYNRHRFLIDNRLLYG